MAKQKFDRTKPHLNVGTIGHIDHGDDETLFFFCHDLSCHSCNHTGANGSPTLTDGKPKPFFNSNRGDELNA